MSVEYKDYNMDRVEGEKVLEECIYLPVKLAFKKLKPNDRLNRRLICWRTKSDFYHVEVIVGDVWISSNSKGTHAKKLEELNDKWVYADIPDATITKEQYAYLLNWIDKNVGKKYDWVAIVFSQLLPIKIQSKDRWICSEACTRVLQILEYSEVAEIEPYTVSPGLLAKLFNVK